MLIITDSKTPLPRAAFARLGDVRSVATPGLNRATVAGADMIVVRSETRVDRDLLDGTRVRFVGTATIGTDHVDIDYLRSRGIGFASAPGSNANSVAEYVVSALLTLSLRHGFLLRGKSIGVVGVGNVGSKVVHMAGGLGMTVLCNDPPLARTTGDRRFLPLEELMESDFITLHVPLTRTGKDATYHLFDARRLAAMKPGSFLLNTSRGGVVETVGLKQQLSSGRLGGAVLDVWENEPTIDTELLSLTDVATAHIAGYSVDGKVNAARMIYEAACRFFGVPPTWEEVADLPPPEYRRIVVADSPGDAETVLLSTIKLCYDIEQDDRNIRTMLNHPESDRGDCFRKLRAGYRVRREFFNSTVILPESQQDLAPVLEALGFKVA